MGENVNDVIEIFEVSGYKLCRISEVLQCFFSKVTENLPKAENLVVNLVDDYEL